jgi:hypothetical protein
MEQEETGLARSVSGVRNSKLKDMRRISVPDVREAVKSKSGLITVSSNDVFRDGKQQCGCSLLSLC